MLLINNETKVTRKTKEIETKHFIVLKRSHTTLQNYIVIITRLYVCFYISSIKQIIKKTTFLHVKSAHFNVFKKIFFLWDKASCRKLILLNLFSYKKKHIFLTRSNVCFLRVKLLIFPLIVCLRSHKNNSLRSIVLYLYKFLIPPLETWAQH
jgi:hypothetical protein